MSAYVRECCALGVPYIYDPSQQIIRLTAEDLIEGTRGAAMLIVNDYEFEMIKNKTGLGDDELARLAGRLIITCGERGSTIITAEGTIQIPAVEPLRLADPTGRGRRLPGRHHQGNAARRQLGSDRPRGRPGRDLRARGERHSESQLLAAGFRWRATNGPSASRRR